MEKKLAIVSNEDWSHHELLYDKYWNSRPDYFDRRRNYFALKDNYLKLLHDYHEMGIERFGRIGRIESLGLIGQIGRLGRLDLIGLLWNSTEADFMGRKQEYQRSFCEEYWVSGPSYFDRRRSYIAVQNEYLDTKRDYLERKDYSMRPSRLTKAERVLVINEAGFLSIEQRFLTVEKDFTALKQEYQMKVEKDFDRMRELTPSVEPDVFLSFRGKDVRGTLADHLSQSLSKAGFRVFLDSKDLKRGAEIWPSLKRAIVKSAICIPIFSEGYADSTWCLKESAAMLETPHLIIPLFYGVDPSDVRYPLNNRSPYKSSFEKHYAHPDRHPRGEIEGWKSALEDICSRSGWTMGVTQDCHVEVERIVKDVIDILRPQEK